MLEQVRQDKRREATDGFDGTWVAHPGLIGVAREEFDRVLRGRDDQRERLREDVVASAADLLDVRFVDGAVTDAGSGPTSPPRPPFLTIPAYAKHLVRRDPANPVAA